MTTLLARKALLPDGWTVVDDPASKPDGLVGAPAYDREGVPVRAVQMVDDGYVRINADYTTRHALGRPFEPEQDLEAGRPTAAWLAALEAERTILP